MTQLRHNDGRPVWLSLAAALSLVVGVVAAVIIGVVLSARSGDEDQLVPAALDQLYRSPYHVTMVITSWVEFEVQSSRAEVDFLPPDRLRRVMITSDGRLLEEIIIGEEAWTGENGHYMVTDAQLLRNTILEPISILNRRSLILGAEDIGDDVMHAGEPTRRYRIVDSAFGQRIVAANASLRTADIYGDLRLEVDLIIGKHTGRLHIAQFVTSGQYVSAVAIWIVDYENVGNVQRPPM